MARSYRDVTQELDEMGITFTGRGKHPNRSTFASRARGWSQERYQKELKRLKRNQEKRERYQALRRETASPRVARRVSAYSQSRYQNYLSLLREQDEPQTLRAYVNNYLVKAQGSISKNDWISYSKDETYPAQVETNAKMINKLAGYDETDSYGWAFIYYVYVRGFNPDDVFQYLESSPFDGNLYEMLLETTGVI